MILGDYVKAPILVGILFESVKIADQPSKIDKLMYCS